MDAVEVDTYPVDLAAQLPRLTGSDGFGRVRVSVNDVISSVNVLKQAPWDRVQDTELCQDVNQIPSFPSEDTSKHLPCSCRSGLPCASMAEEVHPHQKAGKVPRSISRCSKRPRLSHLEDAPLLVGADDGKYLFGLYGLKCDVLDVTKLVDDMSLNDLLDGSYVCPILGKHRGKKAGNVAEVIVHSVRKACSIFQLPKPAKSENPVEMDSSCNETTTACPSSSVSNFDTYSKPESPSISLDFLLEQPSTILERLVLFPPKDLESLLLDAGKPAVHSRNTSDPRPGKNICCQASLPAFSWSNAFSGHTKSNPDGVKFLASRSTCQGGWVRLSNIASFPKVASDSPTDLDSLTYDKSLVPICGPKLPMPQHDKSRCESVSWYELSSSEMVVASISSQFCLESRVDVKYQGRGKHCPRLLAAAQTLCDIATHTTKIDQDGTSWPKKLSEKSMKARKSAPNDKPEEITARPSTSLMHDFERSGMDDVMCKRPKFSTVQSKKVLGHVNSIRRGPISWSTPKSARSLPNKSVKDYIDGARSMAACILKRAMPPPPAKDLSRKFGCQKRVGKLMQMDWNRELDGQG